MHVLDMIEPRKQMLQNDVISKIQPSHSETPIGDPYMGIDSPSHEFYNINTDQSGPPISARHKLKSRLLRTN